MLYILWFECFGLDFVAFFNDLNLVTKEVDINDAESKRERDGDEER